MLSLKVELFKVRLPQPLKIAPPEAFVVLLLKVVLFIVILPYVEKIAPPSLSPLLVELVKTELLIITGTLVQSYRFKHIAAALWILEVLFAKTVSSITIDIFGNRTSL